MEQVEEFQLDEIYPPLTFDKIEELVSDQSEDLKKQLKEKLDFEVLNPESQFYLKQVFIDRKAKSKGAIKARFIQYMESSEEFKDHDIISKNVHRPDFTIDLILENYDFDKIWVFVFDYLDRLTFALIENAIKKEILDLTNSSKENQKTGEELAIPKEIFFICAKLERRVGVEKDAIKIDSLTIPISYFIEYQDPDRIFDDADWIIIDDLKFRGFNFGSVDNIVNAIKNVKGKGEYKIEAESPNGERKVIWEGILFPGEFFKKK
jgi:hypothetical protein